MENWEKVLKLVAPKPNLWTVELGCAQGDDTLKLMAMGAHVVGFDINAESVAMAKNKGVDARVGDIRSLPFHTDWADVVFAANCISLLKTDADIWRALAEMRRIANHGGKIVICTDYLTTTKQPAGNVAYRKTRDGLVSALNELGLQILSEDVMHIPEKPWNMKGQYLVLTVRVL
jgi:ubiquinone/menaquinone biosynthesis C-methylase UbiE